MKGYRSIILHIKPPELDHQKTSDYTTLCPGTEDNYWFPSQLTVCDTGEGRVASISSLFPPLGQQALTDTQ